MKRIATCRCGQLTATCKGEPVRVSVCHCLECQKRTGSAFAAQARWSEEVVLVSGNYNVWERTADSGNKVTYRFCPGCGSTVSYMIEGSPGIVAVPLGAFAGQNMPSPYFSVNVHRKKSWVDILGDAVEHSGDPGLSPS